MPTALCYIYYTHLLIINNNFITDGKYAIFNHYNCDKVDRILMGSWGLQEVWGEGELGEPRNSKVLKLELK